MTQAARTQPNEEELDLAFVDDAVARIGRGPEAVIPILQAIQEHWRYLPQAALRRVCEISEITPAAITGVSTFYTQFRHHPVGRHIISVCHGTACHVKGAQTVSDSIARELKIRKGEDTDPDGVFTVEKVACLGCCTLAPVMQVDSVTYGHLDSPEIIRKSLRDFLELERLGLLSSGGREAVSSDVANGLGEIRICVDSCCSAAGAMDVFNALTQAVRDLRAPAAVRRVGCILTCYEVPLVEVVEPGKEPALYARVRPEDAREIVRRHFKPRSIALRAANVLSRAVEQVLTDDAWEPVTRYSISERDAPICEFIGPQKHIALEHYGTNDPLDIDAYAAIGGFEALRMAVVEQTPEQVIEVVERSGLRGRGGAGFTSATKWKMVHAAKSAKKYLVCNGDEGDPGAFMDRMLLETFPYRVLEGIALAAYSVGADEAYLYVRTEYPMAVKSIEKAVAVCRERGYFGEKIFGSDFSLTFHLMKGAGAFVCGEETALLASIEGKRGTPRLRPPYPAERGLWGKPTCVNNVETLSLVPWILRNGAGAFACLGTEHSRGTKVFALAGKVRRGGLIEVPMGTTIRQIVEEIGGGVPEGRKFKAVQIGGPSGGCIPARLADTPIDYSELQEHGAIMGSGGLVVLDDLDCMVDVARYFLEFTQDQSCGKCTFCRVGTRFMMDIINRLCRGEGRMSDIDELEELAESVKKGSLCGLGQTAPNPVLTTLRYFRDEYEAHVEGRCPARKCVALIRYRITDDCIGCTRCAQHCPTEAIAMRPYEKHEIDPEKCTRCGNCAKVCPADAVTVE